MAALGEPDVTTLLQQAARGDRAAQDRLFRLVESVLRALARGRLAGKQPNPDLQVTVLVDEAFVQLTAGVKVDWQSREQFYGFAKRIMWEIVAKAFRKKKAKRRDPGAPPVTDPDQVAQVRDRSVGDPLARLILDELLTKLEQVAPGSSEVLRCLALGHKEQEIAVRTGLSVPTVRRRLRFARAWLRRALHDGEGGPA
jgi:RNA polymerase sigma factor (TIGR02999 family)